MEESQTLPNSPIDKGSPDGPVPSTKPLKGTEPSKAALTVVTQMAYRDGVRDAITLVSFGIITGLLAHKLWKIEL